MSFFVQWLRGDIKRAIKNNSTYLQLRYLQQINGVDFEGRMKNRQQQARVHAGLLDVQVLEALDEPVGDFAYSSARHQLRVLHRRTRIPGMAK